MLLVLLTKLSLRQSIYVQLAGLMHIGLKIKIARITKGLTQEELAEKVNKTRPLISHIEQTGKVNGYTLKKICSVLDVSVQELENEVKDGQEFYKSNSSQSHKEEIKRLQEEILTLKELAAMQKEVIHELREKMARKKK